MDKSIVTEIPGHPYCFKCGDSFDVGNTMNLVDGATGQYTGVTYCAPCWKIMMDELFPGYPSHHYGRRSCSMVIDDALEDGDHESDDDDDEGVELAVDGTPL